MSKEEKSKGKAAVYLIGSQIGKSGGAWVTQALLLITGSMTASLPIIATVFMAVIVTWLNAVRNLGSMIRKEEEEKSTVHEQDSTRDEDDVDLSLCTDSVASPTS